MRSKVTRNPKRSAAGKASDKLLRERFQRERPSLESLVASGEYAPPITQEENFALMHFAAAFKTLRKKKKLSLADISELTALDRAQISRIENALNPNPTLATLEKLAHALGRRVRITLDEDCGVATR